MESLKKALEIDTIQLSIYEYVIPIIETYKGKEITKRLSTELQKGLEGSFWVAYNPDKYGNRSISIYNHALGYDNSISFDFSIPLHYGELSKIKTWEQSVADIIEQSKARKEHIKESIKALTSEIEIYQDIKNAYVLIEQNYAEAKAELRKKYGYMHDYMGLLDFTYTMRKELESIDIKREPIAKKNNISTNSTLGELLDSKNETIKRNAISILKTLQK